MARFTGRMVSEMVQMFWAAMHRRECLTDAAAEAGAYRKKGLQRIAAAGGVLRRPAPRARVDIGRGSR